MIINTLEIAINLNCNLNCPLCMGHAYLYDEINNGMYDLLQFEKDLIMLKKWVKHIREFSLFGGEPTLNLYMHEYINVINKIYPKSDLCLFTNGLNILSLDKDLINKFSRVCISKYEWSKLDYDYLLNTLMSLYPNINIHFAKPYYINHVNCEGIRDINLNICNINKCNGILYNGYYLKCNRILSINKYIKNNIDIQNYEINGMKVKNIDFKHEDGLELINIKHISDIYNYIYSNKKMKVCNLCLYND